MKIGKRAICLFLVLILTACMLPSGTGLVRAEGESTISYSFENGVLTFTGSGTLTKDDTDKIKDEAFYNNRNITAIRVEGEITAIGELAFWNVWVQPSSSLYIGPSVKVIEAEGVYHCSNLNVITIGSNVETIGESGFEGNSAVEEFVIPDSVKTIGENAFDRCYSLKRVTLGSGLTSIGANAFFGCKSLTSVVIPANVKDIAARAFYECSALETITFEGSSLDTCGMIAPYKALNVNFPCEHFKIGGAIVNDENKGDYFGLYTVNLSYPETETVEVEDKDPTCTEAGYKNQKVCRVCGEIVENTVLDALGHDWGDWEVTTAPTYTAAGVETRTCQREGCGETETRDIPALISSEGIMLSDYTLTLYVGQTYDLGITVMPTGASQEVVCTSSDSSVAAVDISTGRITALAPGKTRIYITSSKNKDNTIVSNGCDVTVLQPVTGVSLNKTSLVLEIGQNALVKATVSPENAFDKSVTWSSDNEAVAVVEEGIVTAVGAGTAVITVTTTNGNKTAVCAVKVNSPAPAAPMISAVAASYNSVKLTIKIPEGAAGCKIYRSTNPSGTFSLIAITSSATYTDSNLAAGTMYYYKAKAYSLSGAGELESNFGATAPARPMPAKTGWNNISNKWYYFDSAGVMLKNWQKIDGKWYYLGTEGAMLTGWQNIDGKRYYLGTDGAMLTGWQKISGKKYYFSSSGQMLTGWQKIDGKWYYLGTDGVMLTGWQKLDGKWYYLGTDGVMLTGRQTIDGKKYCFSSSGQMLTDWQKIDGKWYYYGSSGQMVTGWQKIDSKWYYFVESGQMVTGWQKIDSKWYYFVESGQMVTGWQKIDGKWYYLGSSGQMLTGLQTIEGKRYYLGTDGAMLTGWQKIDGTSYYFESSGAMAVSKAVGSYYVGIDGKMVKNTWIGNYYYGKDGKCEKKK